ncbi:MAG: glutamate--tRNA ligase [Nitrospinota bacterium]|nr:glutamate--tRNA ligase [Nitrospinota bacterium]
MSQIRTRFAPSPTGYLHIGGARTAIFNWLFARRHGGKFILRIEDTDRDRSTEDSISQILEAMKWLGLDYDEGPYRQTDRWEVYHSFAKRLLESGHAYRCVCSKEELDAKREKTQAAGGKPKYDGACRHKGIKADCGVPYVVRIATPHTGKTDVHDLLRGIVSFDNAELDDMIILRTDGGPTYNFCVVVDDAEMAISHVIRGDDHLANTPRQLVIYNALGLKPPLFAHVSMILGNDGKRLSKRHGALSALDYRDKGILPEALVNYLARLGWSHGDEEIFTIEQMKSLFSLEAVGKAAARFDEEKLAWANGEHMRMKESRALAQVMAAMPGFSPRAFGDMEAESLHSLIEVLKPRSRTLLDLAHGARIFIDDKVEYDEKAVAKYLTGGIAPALSGLADRLETADFAHKEQLESVFNSYLEEKGMKLKDLAQPVRVALTGGTVSPGLFDVMFFLGREKCLRRIREAVGLAK